MHTHSIIRYGEIALKGKNRILFERRLVRNIKDALKKNNISFQKVERVRNRILVHTDKPCPFLKNVFGITSFSHAVKTNAGLNDIKETTKKLITNLKKTDSFRVSTKKIISKKNIHGMEVNKEIGAFIKENTNARVDLEHFTFELGIEIINDAAYIFTNREQGFGGLPVGTEGAVLSLIDGNTALLASLLIMKRGCIVIPLSFKKVNTTPLEKFSYGFNLTTHHIKKDADIEKIAQEHHAKALVVADTLDTFKKINTPVTILRPLIGMSQQEIKQKLTHYVH